MKPRYFAVLAVTGSTAALAVLGLAASTTNAQRIDAPRIAPVPKADWSEQQQALMAPLAQTGRDDYHVYTTMLNHPQLMRDWLVFGRHILLENSLPAHDRETLILRIGWLCQAEYEWSRHVPIGKSAGLSDDDIARIISGPGAEGLSAKDRLLLTATDELHADAFISDATWADLSKLYSKEQLMDLVFTVGQYNLVSMALNSFGVQLDDDVTGFPE